MGSFEGTRSRVLGFGVGAHPPEGVGVTPSSHQHTPLFTPISTSVHIALPYPHRYPFTSLTWHHTVSFRIINVIARHLLESIDGLYAMSYNNDLNSLFICFNV